MRAWSKLSLLSLVLVSVFGATAVMASTGTRAIEVIYQDLKLVVRGAPISSPAEPFIYNGSTYVPLRTVAEALGEEVKYDGETKTVYVGKVPVGDTYLSDIKPFDLQGSGDYYVDKYGPNEPFTMGGKSYAQKGLGFGAWLSNVEATYNLNGKYKTLTGKIGLNDRDNQIPISIEIYGDGQKLFDMTPTPGELPQDVTIDLKYALTLKIVVKRNPIRTGATHETRLNFLNAVLHP